MATHTGRVTLDYRFVAIPHDLVLDPYVSAPALRVWCVLAYMDWTREAPTPERLQDYLQKDGGDPPTDRSLRRWLDELDKRGWIAWTRARGNTVWNDKIAVLTHRQERTPESELRQERTPESEVRTPESEVRTPESEVRTPESEVRTPESELIAVHALQQRMNGKPQILPDHERSSSSSADSSRESLRDSDGGDDFFIQLRKRTVSKPKAREIADRYPDQRDQDTILRRFDTRERSPDRKQDGYLIGRLITDILDGLLDAPAAPPSRPLPAPVSVLPPIEQTLTRAQIAQRARPLRELIAESKQRDSTS